MGASFYNPLPFTANPTLLQNSMNAAAQNKHMNNPQLYLISVLLVGSLLGGYRNVIAIVLNFFFNQQTPLLYRT